MRLLCIANPERYARASTDVPVSYARLAGHADVELFHADTRDALAGGDEVPALRVPRGFAPADFAGLADAPRNPTKITSFDAVFCRTLKPFPEGYLERLAGWCERVRFVNDPRGIRRQLDPGFLLEAAGAYLPEACLTGDAARAEAFLREHGTVVAKRPNSCGGREVYRLDRDAEGRFGSDNVVEGSRRFDDFAALFAHVRGPAGDPLLLMRYLRRVTEGDRRLIALDGEILGAYLRIARSGHWVQNVSSGARCEPVAVAPEDAALVAATAPAYARAGIALLGYDLLRDDDGAWRVSEINAGNVGGLARLEQLGARGVTERFVAWLASARGRAA